MMKFPAVHIQNAIRRNFPFFFFPRRQLKVNFTVHWDSYLWPAVVSFPIIDRTPAILTTCRTLEKRRGLSYSLVSRRADPT